MSAESLIGTFQSMEFEEKRQSKNTTRKWCVRKDEQDNHGACKVHEIACRIAFTVLGRCCRYCCLSNKQRAFKFLGWWCSRGSMDREKGKLLYFKAFWL